MKIKNKKFKFLIFELLLPVAVGFTLAVYLIPKGIL